MSDRNDFGSADEAINIAAALAGGIFVAIEESQVFPERRCALPSLIGPALEQLAVVLSVAVGPLHLCVADGEQHDMMEITRRLYPKTRLITEDMLTAFRATFAKRLSYEELQERIRAGLSRLAVNQAMATTPTSLPGVAGGDA